MSFKIENFIIKPLTTFNYVKPLHLSYIQNGIQRNWEAVKSLDSVAVLLYHTQKKAFVLVKQFRAPVYMSDNAITFTYELCAGLVDKQSSIEQITKEEIDEECGYDVPLEKIEKITSFHTNVGQSGSKQYLFYAEVDDSMKIHDGGGLKDEEIIVEYLDISQAKAFIFDEAKAKTPGLMFAFYWFFENFPELTNELL
jgi:UDP-sugar diphosphatase